MKRLTVVLLMIVGVIGCSEDHKGTSPSGDITALSMQLGSPKTKIRGDIDAEGIINPGDTAIWPLKEGNQWTVDQTVFDTAGGIVLRDTFTVGVGEDTIIDGEVWHWLTVNGIPDPEISPVTNRADGLWIGGTSGFLEFKFPAAVHNVYRAGNEWVEVVSTDEAVTVPAGTYSCYCYKYTRIEPGGRIEYRHMSPNVGGIMVDEFYHKAGGGYYLKYHSVLISSSVGFCSYRVGL